MSEDAEKPAEAAAPKKGKMGLIIGIVIALITLVGGSVAGAMLGPRLLGSSAEPAEPAEPEAGHESEKPQKSEKSEKGAHGEGEAEGTTHIINAEMPSVVVDLRDSENRIRHLKVGLTAELADGATVEDFKLMIPRGREATVTYLRSLAFEEVTDPQHFIAIKDELSKRVIEAVGEKRVRRLMLTDFVVQ